MSFTFDTNPGPAIHRAAKRPKQALGSQLKSVDTTPERFSVLTHLWEAHGLTRRQPAGRLQKDKANGTRILDRLAVKGLKERSADPDDRCTLRIVLAGAGRAAEKVSRARVVELRVRAYARLSLAEPERLIAALNRGTANLCAPLDAAAVGRGRE